MRLWYARDEVVKTCRKTATDAKNLEMSREVALLYARAKLPKPPKTPKACTCAQKLKLPKG